MIGSVPAGRRAHAFAEALDEHDRGLGEGTADGDTEQDLLLTLTDALGAVPRPEFDPEAKAAERARLLAVAEAAAIERSERATTANDGRLPGQRLPHRGKGAHRAVRLPGRDRLRPKSRLGKGLAAGGLSVGVAASALGGAAAASSDALPGDALYGLKRSMEDLRLDLADDDADRGRLYLDRASTRLREARRLMVQGSSEELDDDSLAQVRQALSGMRHDAAAARRLLSRAYERHGTIEVMRSLSSFSQDHRSRWQQLRDQLPAPLAQVGEEVSEVFVAMEEQVEPLRPLISEKPDGTGAGRSESVPAEDGARQDGARQDAPTTQPPRTATRGSSEEARRDTDRPEPHRSGSARGGLLSEDGLLRPGAQRPGAQPGQENPGATSTGQDTTSPPPDTTSPPLLPGVLPSPEAGTGNGGGNGSGSGNSGGNESGGTEEGRGERGE